MLSLIRPT